MRAGGFILDVAWYTGTQQPLGWAELGWKDLAFQVPTQEWGGGSARLVQSKGEGYHPDSSFNPRGAQRESFIAALSRIPDRNAQQKARGREIKIERYQERK